MTKRIVGIAGSLRKQSYNKVILHYLTENKYEDFEVISCSIKDVPLFNGDDEIGGDPKPVKALKTAMKEADGILIVTPEYSHGIPGVLKNALDWAGSMTNENVLDKKPVMIVGASPSGMGTGFAQAQLRQVLAACNAFVLPQPQIYIGQVNKKLNENGELKDEKTSEFLLSSLQAFSVWIERLTNSSTQSG